MKTTQPNRISSLLAHAADNPILSLFLEKKTEEFKSFEQREIAKQDAVEYRRTLVDRIKDSTSLLAAAKFKIEELTGLDEVEVVLAGIRSEREVIPNFLNMRDRVATIQFAKNFGPKIIKRLAERLQEAHNELREHDRRNGDLLREAGVEL